MFKFFKKTSLSVVVNGQSAGVLNSHPEFSWNRFCPNAPEMNTLEMLLLRQFSNRSLDDAEERLGSNTEFFDVSFGEQNAKILLRPVV